MESADSQFFCKALKTKTEEIIKSKTTSYIIKQSKLEPSLIFPESNL